jgi:uncharacterized protein YbjT (DUF2867 family)
VARNLHSNGIHEHEDVTPSGNEPTSAAVSGGHDDRETRRFWCNRDAFDLFSGYHYRRGIGRILAVFLVGRLYLFLRLRFVSRYFGDERRAPHRSRRAQFRATRQIISSGAKNGDAYMFVILGATGKVGRMTIKKLRAQGAPVRAVVRKSSNVDDLNALGCEIAVADLSEAAAIKSAIWGAEAVQVICPVQAQAADAAGEMAKTIDVIAGALTEVRPARVLAISDYGAQVSEGTGITMAFYYLEAQFRGLPSAVTFLRSAEHMQNWGRVMKVATETGVLPSLHHPLSKRFPTVSALDVGSVAAELLTDGTTAAEPRIVHVEGPRRYDAIEAAATLSKIIGREIVARELPQSDWIPTLTRAGAGPSYAKLVFELYVAHNAGRIDVEPGATDVRFGATELRDVFVGLLGR